MKNNNEKKGQSIHNNNVIQSLYDDVSSLMKLRIDLLKQLSGEQTQSLYTKSHEMYGPSGELINYVFPNQKPAVPIALSVGDDFLICLEDGKKVKLLEIYLKRRYNMTPDFYRRKWELDYDYPMIPKNYREIRQKIAKDAKLGLGAIKRGRKKKIQDIEKIV